MTTQSQSNSWSAKQALILAAICFLLGSAIGYLGHGPTTPKPEIAATSEVPQSQPQASVAPEVAENTVTPEQMKAASAKAAGTVLDKLKADPKNFKLLVEAGEMFYHHGSYVEAGSYYQRALAVKDDVAVRNRYASALFFTGDGDAAIQQYEKVLAKDPKNDVALFNEGMVLYKTKKDRAGAIEHWKKLLADYPDHPHRQDVQRMIDNVSKQS